MAYSDEKHTPVDSLGETPVEKKIRYNLFRQSLRPKESMQLRQPGIPEVQVPEQQEVQAAQVAQPTQPIQMPNQNPDTDGMNYLTSLYTSPREEEKYRKASLNRQRILAVGDALRHIGNIYHTVKYSPSQQFNSPVQEEYGRYEREKGIRDAANQRYMSYQQAKAAQEEKARQWAAEFGWKQEVDNRNFGETQRRNDAYVNNLETRTKNEAEKLQGIQADNKRKQFEADIAPKKFDLQTRNINSQIASRADASRRAWANYNLSVARFRRGGGGSRSLAGTSKDRDLFVSPDGSTYSFPKGVINKNRINYIYNSLKNKGWFKKYGGDAKTDDAKWDAIMHMAGTTKQGHDAFIYFANKLGYQYEGGMDPATVDKYWGPQNKIGNLNLQ